MLKKILFYLVYFLSPAVLMAVIYFSNPSYFAGSRFDLPNSANSLNIRG